MAVSIAPVEDNDIPTFVRIELEAFRNHPRIPMLWTKGYTDDLYAFKEEEKREILHDPKCHLFKAIDQSTGEIIAVSQWTFALDPAVHKPADPEEQPPANWPAGGNWELRRSFGLNAEKWRDEFLSGKPYIKLEYLVANPLMQRRGAGSRLLTWGVEQADKQNVLLCLESTPLGVPLYERFGFQEVAVIKDDMKKFGWNEPYDEEETRRVFMIRQPHTLN